MKSKESIKQLIQSIGIETVLQSLIEMMDANIDATDYDVESLRNPNDLWKFKVIEGLEHAYESYLNKDNQIIGESTCEST